VIAGGGTVGGFPAWKATQVRDDELKDLQDFATAMNTRMDALVANADALRRLLEQVGATHQAAVAQLAEAQRQGLERAIAARVGARLHEPLREAKTGKSRGASGKRAAGAARALEAQDPDSVSEQTAGGQSDGRSGVVAFERRERSQTI
jgi:ABC-type transporter Mla subunit MlaD